MKDLPELYKDLQKYSNFGIPENIDKFLETIDMIALKKDPACIGELIKYFDDNTEYSWVLTSLRKTIEKFDRKDYINTILKNLNFLVSSTPSWADEIVNSIFNNEEDKNYFWTHISLTSKDALLKLFEIMEKESPHHKDLINKLKQEL